ncbi:MAG: hypothetical protein U0900_04295 [Myxococcota bacterium]
MRAGWALGGAMLTGWILSATDAGALPSSTPSWRRNGITGQMVGSTVSSAGDFNCDGIADLAVGAPFAGTTPTGTLISYHQGWVGVWYGDPILPPQPNEPPDWFVTGNGAASPSEAELGWMIAAGDVSGDGCDDLIVGNRATPAGTAANVRAYFGAVGGPDTTFDWRRTIPSFGAALPFGFSGQGDVATGDVNGDGTDDILVGIPDAGFGQAEEGAVFVWIGGPGLASVLDAPANPDWIAESNQAGAKLGFSVASGDVDADGREDVVAGAPDWNGSIPNSADSGIALMWRGSPTLAAGADGTVANAAWSLQIGAANARLGWSVAVAGDLDGDGFGDILAGAPYYDNPFTVGTAEGTVVVTRGASPAPPTDLYSWTHFGQDRGWLGWSVAGAGDVNGDGFDDYLMGEPRDNADATLHGRTHLVRGRATAAWGPNPATDVFFAEVGLPNTPHAESFGQSVASIGDWNDDGGPDIVVGAPGIDTTGGVFSLDGVAFVYLGDEAGAMPLVNGWINGFYGTRTTSAVAENGIVSFKGALTSGTNALLFTLPVGLRPATDTYVAVDLCGAVPGRLYIQPNGSVFVNSSTTFGDAQCFISLESAKFALSATGFTPLTLVNGWVGGPFSTSPPAAALIDGTVHLKGAMGSGTTNLAFTLPPAMRPATDVYLPIGLCNAQKGRLWILASGEVSVFARDSFADAQCFTSLDGISFVPSANGSAPLALSGGWIGAPFSTSPPAATLVRNTVHLKGAIGGGTSSTPFTLPPILRPLANVYVPVDLCNANKGRLQIQPDGSVFLSAQSNFADAQCFTSLDGVSFPVPEPTGIAVLGAGALLVAGLGRARAGRARR